MSREVLLGDTLSVNLSVLDAATKTLSEQNLLWDLSSAKDWVVLEDTDEPFF